MRAHARPPARHGDKNLYGFTHGVILPREGVRRTFFDGTNLDFRECLLIHHEGHPSTVLRAGSEHKDLALEGKNRPQDCFACVNPRNTCAATCTQCRCKCPWLKFVRRENQQSVNGVSKPSLKGHACL
jgi:hypothetical protein